MGGFHRGAKARALVVGSVLGLLAACSGPRSTPPVPEGTIVVASFDFPESVLLAEIYGGAIAAKGLPVRMALDLGPRELVQPALQRGLVGLVPEYAGSALDFVSGREVATADPATTHGALTAALAPVGITALGPAPGQDANGFAVTRATAERFHLETISDLRPVASRLVFGGPPECPDRPLCLRGLRSVYGLEFRRFVPLDAGGPLTIAALTDGDVGVALTFTTDPAIAERGLVVLRDDRGLEPAENVTPVVSRRLVRRYGDDLVGTVDAVSTRLTTGALVSLNQAVARGTSPHSVATSWLAQEGLAG
jgi:osmoprotectant transport system substrate-binding protein